MMSWQPKNFLRFGKSLLNFNNDKYPHLSVFDIRKNQAKLRGSTRIDTRTLRGN